MAGILYLFRLLVYASEQGVSQPAVYALLKTMSRRLLRAITIPAMVVSWLAGATMVYLNPSLLLMPWFVSKLVCVLLLTGSTFYASSLVMRYQLGENPLPSSKKLRLWNEVPTLLMILIVGLVILRPQLFKATLNQDQHVEKSQLDR